MHKVKIVNDPVYGFISIPYGLIFDLVEHPFFQRLRRIKQTSLSHYVYPGALHTRFHHALGAYHLMSQALMSLEQKGVPLTEEEKEAACVAILLHDIGHGPFSHTLEKNLIGVSHEVLSALFMESLNRTFDGKLDLAIAIFNGSYHKTFLHQLIGGQLDMDRMDYLNRDSYFTGVHEGVIGYDRIIKMLNVVDNQLVVEEKGIYSVEKFLIARRLMYWQVYLHKTVVSAEKMLVLVLKRAREIMNTNADSIQASSHLLFFLKHSITAETIKNQADSFLMKFAGLDDHDIVAALKNWSEHSDFLLRFLSKSLLNRQLFKTEFQNEPIPASRISEVKDQIKKALPTDSIIDPEFLMIVGSETNTAYWPNKEEILILHKNGQIHPMSSAQDYILSSSSFTKYYLCYPKFIPEDA
jgi:HD superfamily phosphohydrolase